MPTSANYASSGIVGLDQVMHGGFPHGQLSLIRGASGAGKTTLCLQFLIEGARRSEKTLYLGTSETTGDIRRIAQSHGWSLEGVALHHHGASTRGVEQTMLHPAQIELPETIETILSVVKQHDPTRLVIDSLTEIRVLARDESWYRRQLMELKQHFADKQCTVLFTQIENDEHPTLDSVVSAVLQLEQTTPAYGPIRRHLKINKIRGVEFTTGYHDYKIRKGGLEVFPRLTAADHRQRFPFEQFSTGMAEMDAMLRGGLHRGTSILLLGPSGTGKSLMATQFLVAAAERGERSAMYIFDERIQTLFQRTEGVGLPLKQHVEEGTIQVRQIDPAELTSGELSYSVQQLVEREGIQILAIDSLNGYAYAMPDTELLSVHLHELFSYLSQRAVTPIFTMTQHGLFFDHGQQAFEISYLADTVILFRHFEFAGRIRKALSIYKCRSGPHATLIRQFNIGSEGVSVSQPLTQFQGVLAGTPQFIGAKLGECPAGTISDDQ